MIVKPRSRIIQDLDAASFTVLGCPGADGLGAGALQIFHAGLAGARGDFIVVLGDVAPVGRDPYYHQIADFIDSVTDKPVHVMRGNHDGPDYPAYFGMENCAVVSEDYLLIMLDNSARKFSDDALKFLRETMALIDSDNVLIAFHVPPPNRFNGSSLPKREWQRFEDAVGVWRSRITLLLGSHAHNGFEDDVDGLKLVVTGGAGARMHAADRLSGQDHHALEISLGGGAPVVAMRRLPLTESVSGVPAGSEHIPDPLHKIYDECCRQRVELILHAEEAEARGEYNLSRLYRAASESSQLQARALYGLAGRDLARDEALSIVTVEKVDAAKVSFELLLDRAAQLDSDGNIESVKYFVCQSCGLITAGSDAATYCSECGAPGHFIGEVW